MRDELHDVEQPIFVESDTCLEGAGAIGAANNIPFFVALRDAERLLVFDAGGKHPQLCLLLGGEVLCVSRLGHECQVRNEKK